MDQGITFSKDAIVKYGLPCWLIGAWLSLYKESEYASFCAFRRSKILKERGRSHMCKAMEEMREEAVHKDRIENALKMIASGRLTNQEIADWTGLALSEVEELAG